MTGGTSRPLDITGILASGLARCRTLEMGLTATMTGRGSAGLRLGAVAISLRLLAVARGHGIHLRVIPGKGGTDKQNEGEEPCKQIAIHR